MTQVANRAVDQVQVIEMLMAIPAASGGRQGRWELPPLVSERVCSPDLHRAIVDFQTLWKQRGEFRVVDGVVDPGGTTFTKLQRLSSGGAAPQPAPQPVPPQGVQPTPEHFAAVTFDPPLFYGPAVKISLTDPYVSGAVRVLLAPLGVSVPIGFDLVIGEMKGIRNGKPGAMAALRPAGYLLGLTPRHGAGGTLTAGKLAGLARSRGASATMVKFLEALAKELDKLPTSFAANAGIGVLAAKGFASVSQMNGFSGGADEASFALGLEGDFKGLWKLLLKGVELQALGAQAWEMLALLRQLAADKTKAIACLDIPGLSAGFDIGAAKGSASWYSIDLDRLLR
ncbi:hypothetical protein [Frigidibacter oleivorans]|uniref:hypothetical protein n=1 Tax=Frigidibacter oleivorans TaxID=2487129 RepID=UPI000F8EB4CE|nr:hypothetical protein [Frigidibacter oleivorans]